MRMRIAAAAGLMGLCAPAMMAAQQGTAAPPPGFRPTVPGYVVVYSSPIKGDTLSVLCADRQKPGMGFLTTGASSGVELGLWPTPRQSGSLTVVFKEGGREYSAQFDVGNGSSAGWFLAAGHVVAAGASSGKDISFTANCAGEDPGG